MPLPASIMKLPGAPALWAALPSGNSKSKSGRGGSAARLTAALPTLRRCPQQLRSLLVRAVDLQSEIDNMEPQPALTGRWKKCKEASDPMDEACDMVALPWVYRKAIGVLNNLEVEDTEQHFRTNLKAGGIMDVIEQYPWSGDKVVHPRRDKRRGQHTAHVVRTEAGHPCIVCSWEDPYGGDCTDTFELSTSGDTLMQHTDMSIRSNGRRTQYKTVFQRVHAS